MLVSLLVFIRSLELNASGNLFLDDRTARKKEYVLSSVGVWFEYNNTTWRNSVSDDIDIYSRV